LINTSKELPCLSLSKQEPPLLVDDVDVDS